MTTSVTSATATSTTASAASSAAAASTGAAAPLGQDAFLKLLMAQLANQDPTQPTDSTQFVTQLAQFSVVEQSVAQTTQLTNIGTQLQGLSNSETTALVGQTVTAQGSGLQWNGTFATTADVTLAGPAQQVTVQVQDSQGNTVKTMTLGAQAAGTLPITWNGIEDSGQPAPAGSYSVNVSATDASGAPVAVAQTVTGVVDQVSFAQGYPALTLSTGAVVPISQLVSVGAPPITSP
jgi:flagellar basal-body rod modification protein FlgD